MTTLQSGLTAIHLLDSGELPTELRLFARGPNRTRKGTFIYDEVSRKAIEKHLAGATDKQPFDINHMMFKPESGPDGQKAVAWYRLDLRDDGIYAVDIEWGEYAIKALTAREFRFFSPTILIDSKKRINAILAVALTNTPASYQQEPIVAHDEGVTHMSDDILVALGVDSEEAGVSLASKLKTLNTQLLELTGAENTQDIIHQIVKLQEGKDAAEQQLADYKHGAEIDKTIVELSTSGKLPPSMHDFARSLGSIEQVQQLADSWSASHLATDTTVVASNETLKNKKLTDEEIAVAKQLGVELSSIEETV